MTTPIELKEGNFQTGDSIRFSQNGMDMLWIGKVVDKTLEGLLVDGQEFTAKMKYGQKFSILEKV